MTLMSEITALRAAIEKNARSAPENEAQSTPSSETPNRGEDKQNGIDALLEAVGATVEEFGQDVDKFPRLTALAAFGVGLSLGLALGSKVR